MWAVELSPPSLPHQCLNLLEGGNKKLKSNRIGLCGALNMKLVKGAECKISEIPGDPIQLFVMIFYCLIFI